VDQKIQEFILKNLKRPTHISYIKDRIIKKDIESTMMIIKELCESNLIEESSLAKNYYVTKENV